MVQEQKCQRCKEHSAIIISRKELFCSGCFKKFLSLKQRKTMMLDQYYQDIFKVLHKDKFRTEEEALLLNSNSKILVPLSFSSSSSLVMLDILVDTLNEQRLQHHNMVGFKIELLLLFNGKEEFDLVNKKLTDLIDNRYSANKDCIQPHFVEISKFYETSTVLKQLLLQHTDFKTFKDTIQHDDYTIKNLLKECPNRSVREDLLTFIKRHLIKKFTYQNKFKAIVWPFSMTQLADEIISMIVKGRGSSIANFLDMESFDENYGTNVFKNLFPLRNALLSEIDAYCHSVNLEKYLIDYKVQDTLLLNKLYDANNKRSNESTLVKNMTMNELASKYFDDIETDYSNVISTVLRTGEKLGTPTANGLKNKKCEVCLQIIHNDPSEWLNTITENVGHCIENDEEQSYFNVWTENNEKKVATKNYNKLMELDKDENNNLDICYGCLILLNSMDNKSINWPVNEKEEIDEILEEFIISD
ncbi:hypothetical protein TPHA_0I01520 [Tetrapisispora phaffii CBS 4417]|uniref:Cytoplasmic tRNA 2-thiolation protein 2 n=1 Tax=Tetrapisispora phaffii (strain ATCC 24235 / CBS 4417 / NBRC 1672 / NRRL Y-8282 / UCD 70-5) TaxID=1071381 RepID=G8BXN0_TETPH|nr:hypothetical protein TPHA_0I01520 [Tetrapisispora phaffii CBS 4417]CCE64658.1 hypothetical protein TPHA_0I01520 [Tetrapisispora phaffii CBS 4417]